MKQWAHLIVSIALAVTTITLFAITQGSDLVKALDKARYYTLVRERGDVDAAANLLKGETWLPESCQLETNLTAPCQTLRTTLQTNILALMKCNLYSSQVCSYLRSGLRYLAMNTTDRVYAPNGTFTTRTVVVGKKMSGKSPTGETYGELLKRMVTQAPVLFHSASRAEQSDSSTNMLHSSLYTLIAIAILGNIIVHIADSYNPRGYTRLLWRLLGAFILCTMCIVFLVLNSGSYLILLLIAIPSLVILVHFEYLLDPTIERPWVHPWTFSVIYTCVTLLSLAENGILDFNTTLSEVLVSLAVGQLFMGITWYTVGNTEKLTSGEEHIRELHVLYQTKEVQYALFMSITLILILPTATILAPYAYTFASPFLSLSPLVFAILGVFSTLVIQNMPLDDLYGMEIKKPTTITSAKLYASFLLLLFGLATTLHLLTEHSSTYRYYFDFIPDKAIQSDLGRSYLFGLGLNQIA